MAELRTASCHCGTVKFTITLDNGIGELRRCTCSLCRKKGAVMASVPLANLQITAGEDALTLYQWNTKIAKHYFCSTCGIYTHHQRRSRPDEFAFNVGCLDDNVSANAKVVWVDGATLSVVES